MPRLIYQPLGSGAFSGKMLLVRMIENNKINAFFRLALPCKVSKGIMIVPRRVRSPPYGLEIGNELPQIIFNILRSSIKTRSAPDFKKKYMKCSFYC